MHPREILSAQTTRRRFVGLFPAMAVPAVLRAQPGDPRGNRLAARPGAATQAASAGLRALGLRTERDALLYIPESAKPGEKAALVVSLHGATRNADRGIDILRPLADQLGFLLLAPASEDRTWDAILGDWGPDVVFINRSLARTFELRTVDPGRIAMAGFSDGASYSLSIGLSNGDLFSAVFGFSPGFVAREPRAGKPPVFISHGTLDRVLPIDMCSRLIVPELKREGYQVTFREFEGPHTLPPDVAAEAMRWFMDGKRPLA